MTITKTFAEQNMNIEVQNLQIIVSSFMKRTLNRFVLSSAIDSYMYIACNIANSYTFGEKRSKLLHGVMSQCTVKPFALI